jgi:hypothetical protein
MIAARLLKVPIVWASSYALITVGAGATLDKLIEYIKNQEKPD